MQGAGGLFGLEMGLSRSVYALTLDPRDFILHLQLAALEFGQFEIVNAVMLLRLGNFVVEGLVALLELGKIRLDGHGRVSPSSDFSLTLKLCHGCLHKSAMI
jgi:hypothetical protein